jgi:hypothetical protein
MSEANAHETTAIRLFESAMAAASCAPSEPADCPSQPIAPRPLKDAVHNCLLAYNRAFDAERAAGGTESAAEDKAGAAFRIAMPILTSKGNVQAFIACVSYGMVRRAFWHDEGPRFLAAAKTALAAFSPEAAPIGRQKTADSVLQK